MRRSALILISLILAACSATQLSAHEQSQPRIINPELFEPIVIKESATAQLPIMEGFIESPNPTKPPIKQPKPKKEVTIKVIPKVHTANADSNPKKFALGKIGQKQFNCLEPLWEKESHWNYKAHNHSSGAYGIPQSVPGSKMASAGADWKTNPITQVKWGIGYVNGRYGSACGAWSFWKRNGWY
jgi:hypothetical protein